MAEVHDEDHGFSLSLPTRSADILLSLPAHSLLADSAHCQGQQVNSLHQDEDYFLPERECPTPAAGDLPVLECTLPLSYIPGHLLCLESQIQSVQLILFKE